MTDKTALCRKASFTVSTPPKGVFAKIETHKLDNPNPDEWFHIDYSALTLSHVGWNSAEWLSYRLLGAGEALRMCIEMNPKKRGGIPVIVGTRITAAEMLAEIADGKRSIDQISQAFDIDGEAVKKFLRTLAIYLDRPFPQSTSHANIFSTRRKLKRF